MEDDLTNLIQYKSEMEQLCDQLKNKMERKKAKEKYLKETLEFRE